MFNFLKSKKKKIFAIPDPNKRIIALSEELNSKPIDKLSDVEKNFLSIDELEGDVNNDGFYGYLYNSAGDNWDVALRALGLIGAGQAKKIFEEALSIFPNSAPPKDRAERQATLEQIGEKNQVFLDETDKKFYEYPDDLTELLSAYIEKNKDIILFQL
jgi:hypothetical protein